MKCNKKPAKSEKFSRQSYEIPFTGISPILSIAGLKPNFLDKKII